MSMGSKMRRTSLPAISVQRSSLQPPARPAPGQTQPVLTGQTINLSTTSAIISEAHGIVTDMLVDRSSSLLPPHILAGLHSLAELLEPPGPSPSGAGVTIGRGYYHPHHHHHQQQQQQQQQLQPGTPSRLMSLTKMDDVLSLSVDELPFVGESAAELFGRSRTVHPSTRRRMSCATWSTTTSATGMPSMEPEPVNRRRSTIFHSMSDASPTVSPAQSVTDLVLLKSDNSSGGRMKPHTVSDITAHPDSHSKQLSLSISSLQTLPIKPQSRQSGGKRNLSSATGFSGMGVRRAHSTGDDDSRASTFDDETPTSADMDECDSIRRAVTSALPSASQTMDSHSYLQQQQQQPSSSSSPSSSTTSGQVTSIIGGPSFSPRRLSVLQEEELLVTTPDFNRSHASFVLPPGVSVIDSTGQETISCSASGFQSSYNNTTALRQANHHCLSPQVCLICRSSANANLLMSDSGPDPTICRYCPVHRRTSEPYTTNQKVLSRVLGRGAATSNGSGTNAGASPYVQHTSDSSSERRHSANLECTMRHSMASGGFPPPLSLCRCAMRVRHCRIPSSPTRCCDVTFTNGDGSHGGDPSKLAFIKELALEGDGDQLYKQNQLDFEEPTDDKTILLKDGSVYNTDHLKRDPLLASIHLWDYPIFDLEKRAGNQMLSQVCYRVFHVTGLLETFRIPLQEFFNYFHALELGYRDKPYHNRMHATDVLQAVYYLTSQPIPGFQNLPTDTNTFESAEEVGESGGVGGGGGGGCHVSAFAAEDSYGVMGANMPALELMALYTAAAMHDYDHPGRTNAFLVSTMAPQAVLYNDRAVLENHHAASAWSLFLSHPEHNFLCHLERSEFKRFRFLVIEAILATDLKRHFEILAEFSSKAREGSGIDWRCETDRLLVSEMCIKLADINGPCKDFPLHYQWTMRIAEEFYEQGDEEQELGLPVSPYMDRKNPQLAKLQESFINHLVGPICNCYYDCGLMPGIWVEKEESCSSLDSENEDDEEDSSCASKHRNVFCIQTEHLVHNHSRWTEVLKEEQSRCEVSISVSVADTVSASETSDQETTDVSHSNQHPQHHHYQQKQQQQKQEQQLRLHHKMDKSEKSSRTSSSTSSEEAIYGHIDDQMEEDGGGGTVGADSCVNSGDELAQIVPLIDEDHQATLQQTRRSSSDSQLITSDQDSKL